MSIEFYENLKGRAELYEMISSGLKDIKTSRTSDFDEAMQSMKKRRKR